MELLGKFLKVSPLQRYQSQSGFGNNQEAFEYYECVFAFGSFNTISVTVPKRCTESLGEFTENFQAVEGKYVFADIRFRADERKTQDGVLFYSTRATCTSIVLM